MASGFSEAFDRRLQSLTNTMDSIQGLSAWIIEHKQRSSRIVERWIKCVRKSSIDHRLNLLYLANDVVQNCKRKDAIEFREEFSQAFLEAATLVRDPSIRKSAERIFSIWKQRNIYDEDLINKFREALVNAEVRVDTHSNVLSEFRPKVLVEQLNAHKKLQNAVITKEQEIMAQAEFWNTEALKRLKDRTEGKKFSKDLETANTRMAEFCSQLEKDVKMKPTLIDSLDKSEIFYEAQYKEVKIVVNAYKNFANRVNNLKKKLEQVREKLLAEPESPVPSPSIDAPSPSTPDSLIDEASSEPWPTVAADSVAESAVPSADKEESKKGSPLPSGQPTTISSNNDDNQLCPSIDYPSLPDLDLSKLTSFLGPLSGVNSTQDAPSLNKEQTPNQDAMNPQTGDLQEHQGSKDDRMSPCADPGPGSHISTMQGLANLLNAVSQASQEPRLVEDSTSNQSSHPALRQVQQAGNQLWKLAWDESIPDSPASLEFAQHGPSKSQEPHPSVDTGWASGSSFLSEQPHSPTAKEQVDNNPLCSDELPSDSLEKRINSFLQGNPNFQPLELDLSTVVSSSSPCKPDVSDTMLSPVMERPQPIPCLGMDNPSPIPCINTGRQIPFLLPGKVSPSPNLLGLTDMPEDSVGSVTDDGNCGTPTQDEPADVGPPSSQQPSSSTVSMHEWSHPPVTSSQTMITASDQYHPAGRGDVSPIMKGCLSPAAHFTNQETSVLEQSQQGGVSIPPNLLRLMDMCSRKNNFEPSPMPATELDRDSTATHSDKWSAQIQTSSQSSWEDRLGGPPVSYSIPATSTFTSTSSYLPHNLSDLSSVSKTVSLEIESSKPNVHFQGHLQHPPQHPSNESPEVRAPCDSGKISSQGYDLPEGIHPPPPPPPPLPLPPLPPPPFMAPLFPFLANSKAESSFVATSQSFMQSSLSSRPLVSTFLPHPHDNSRSTPVMPSSVAQPVPLTPPLLPLPLPEMLNIPPPPLIPPPPSSPQNAPPLPSSRNNLLLPPLPPGLPNFPPLPIHPSQIAHGVGQMPMPPRPRHLSAGFVMRSPLPRGPIPMQHDGPPRSPFFGAGSWLHDYPSEPKHDLLNSDSDYERFPVGCRDSGTSAKHNTTQSPVHIKNVSSEEVHLRESVQSSSLLHSSERIHKSQSMETTGGADSVSRGGCEGERGELELDKDERCLPPSFQALGEQHKWPSNQRHSNYHQRHHLGNMPDSGRGRMRMSSPPPYQHGLLTTPMSHPSPRHMITNDGRFPRPEFYPQGPPPDRAQFRGSWKRPPYPFVSQPHLPPKRPFLPHYSTINRYQARTDNVASARSRRHTDVEDILLIQTIEAHGGSTSFSIILGLAQLCFYKSTNT
uniref:regulation of nuclear pre-mRNA domain-containing protein 2 isoform X2 n=1 Tax=Myxine glutinosa TaxID=7769 RepID=UPI0035901016